MMEKLGEPQTHLGLKAMIKEVDEDNDGEISFREVIARDTTRKNKDDTKQLHHLFFFFSVLVSVDIP